MKALRNLALIAVCVSLLAFTVPVAHADVVYTFSGVNAGPFPNSDGLPVALQYTSSGFITSLTQVFASQLDSCTNCFVSTIVPAAEFRPDQPGGVDGIGFVDVNQIEYFYYFPLGALSTPGTYCSNATAYPGTLTVTETVPEPSMLTLLGAGLLGLTGIGRRKFTARPR